MTYRTVTFWLMLTFLTGAFGLNSVAQTTRPTSRTSTNSAAKARSAPAARPAARTAKASPVAAARKAPDSRKTVQKSASKATAPNARKTTGKQTKSSSKKVAKAAQKALKKAAKGGQKVDVVQKKFASDFRKKFWDRGPLLALLLIFVMGFLVSLTPCVYPMIPITIAVIGANTAQHEGSGRSRSLFLAIMYVMGMAIPYSILGAVVGFIGKQPLVLGSLLNNKFFLGALVLIFTAMALSLFGMFNISLPSNIQTRLAGVQGRSKGVLGVLILGMIGAILATPCSGPVAIGLLAFVAQSGSALLGFFLCFVFSLGIGVPFLVLGAGVVTALPRSGVWMNEVKKVLGSMLLGAALYYLYFLLDGQADIYRMILAVTLVLGSVFAGVFQSYATETWWWYKLKQGVGLLMLVTGLYLFVGGLLTQGFLLPPVSKWGPKPVVQKVIVQQIAGTKGTKGAQKPAPRDPCLPPAGYPANKPFWFTNEKKGVACAKKLNRPYIIDFWAEWCSACKRLEKYSFNHPIVVKESRRFVMIKIKYSEDTKEGRRLQKRYNIRGLPWVRFVSAKGKILDEPLIVGFLDHKKLLKQLKSVR